MPGPGKFSVPTFLFVFLSQIPAFMLEFPVFHACSCAIRPTKDAFPPSVRPSRPPAGQKNETQPRRAGLRFLCGQVCRNACAPKGKIRRRDTRWASPTYVPPYLPAFARSPIACVFSTHSLTLRL